MTSADPFSTTVIPGASEGKPSCGIVGSQKEGVGTGVLDETVEHGLDMRFWSVRPNGECQENVKLKTENRTLREKIKSKLGFGSLGRAVE